MPVLFIAVIAVGSALYAYIAHRDRNGLPREAKNVETLKLKVTCWKFNQDSNSYEKE
uniref:Uncharacterized protein n=2 Tax=unclassified Wolbachia TaxID=2640676 RepID=A0AAU7YKY3_9RICK